MHKKVQIHSKTCVLLENKKSFYLQAKHKISFVSLFFVSASTQLSFMNDDVAILLSRAICYLDINFQFLSENIALEKSIIKQIWGILSICFERTLYQTKVSFFWDRSQDMSSSGFPQKNKPMISRPDWLANQRPGFLVENHLNSCSDSHLRKKLTLEYPNKIIIPRAANYNITDRHFYFLLKIEKDIYQTTYVWDCYSQQNCTVMLYYSFTFFLVFIVNYKYIWDSI